MKFVELFAGAGGLSLGLERAGLACVGHAVLRPRRLMPLECERLMGWPNNWTAEGVDERGRRYALKDTPRYRLCGNGVGAPVAEWIGRRLMEAVQSQQAEEAA